MQQQPVCLSCEDPTLVFVFGSNARGQHLAGAARHAHDIHGAEWGEGDGHWGHSYAIDTMSGMPALCAGVSRFLEYANDNPGLRFFVTPIGTGIAGYTLDQIAPLFADAPENCTLPADWRTK